MEVLVEKIAFRFSKRAPRADTARNKWLKYALMKLACKQRQASEIIEIDEYTLCVKMEDLNILSALFLFQKN